MFLANTSSPRNACQQALQTHGLGWQGFRIRCDGANHLRIAAKKSDQQQLTGIPMVEVSNHIPVTTVA